MTNTNLANTDTDAVAETLTNGQYYEVTQGAEYAKKFDLVYRGPLAEKYPYTFGLPNEECLKAIGEGDTVSVMVYWLERPKKPCHFYGGEIVQFEVLSSTPDYIVGRMKMPFDWPTSDSDVVLKFGKWAVVDVNFADAEYQPLAELPQKKYRACCLIDTAARHRKGKIRHIFRDEPKRWKDDKDNSEYPDSGWRISGDSSPLCSAEVEYESLCWALNWDDSWLSHIDAPVGSAFKKDENTGLFMPDKTPCYSFTREEPEQFWKYWGLS
jgi:hypothetical protein